MSNSLAGLYDAFDKMLKTFEEDRRELVEQAGIKMCQQVIHNIETSTKEHTGNLKKAVYIANGSGGGYAAVRNDYKIAKHAHLIEFGHRVVRGGPLKLTKKQQAEGKEAGTTIKDADGNEKMVPGKHMYRNAMLELEDELKQDAEKMMDKLVGDSFG